LSKALTHPKGDGRFHQLVFITLLKSVKSVKSVVKILSSIFPFSTHAPFFADFIGITLKRKVGTTDFTDYTDFEEV
jgi:hypothetical protein